MASIVAQNQRTADPAVDTLRISASAVLERYLSLPVSTHAEGTYQFWRNHSMTTDRAQKFLCELARIHLTPPPTSTGMCNFYTIIVNNCPLATILLIWGIVNYQHSWYIKIAHPWIRRGKIVLHCPGYTVHREVQQELQHCHDWRGQLHWPRQWYIVC